MLKKIVILSLLFFGFLQSAYSAELNSSSDIKEVYKNEIPIQKTINEIGYKILNANIIDKHITFYFESKNSLINADSIIPGRKVIIYEKYFKQAENEDELAALIAREISYSIKTFEGGFCGLIGTAHVKLAPKKYETHADKRAVDFLVKSGYNPIALITYLNKAFPEARQDKISKHNLTSKRMMLVYEKIYREYPSFILKNKYLTNDYYQNFLLNSIDARAELREKVAKEHKGNQK